MYAKFLLAATFIAGSALGQKASGLSPSHGTINIFLANRNGLVAVTDSRLSSNGKAVARGQKLFKVDDHTICAVAGFYMDSGVPLKTSRRTNVVSGLYLDLGNSERLLSRQSVPD